MFKQKTFNQFLFSYLLLLMIPVLLFSLVLFRVAVTSLEKEITAHNMGNAQLLADTMDDWQSSMRGVASEISLNNSFKIVDGDNSNLVMLNEREILKAYAIAIPFLSDLLYYHADSRVFSGAKSSYSFYTLIHGEHQFTGITEEQLYQRLNGIRQSTFIPAGELYQNENDERYCFYVVPLPINAETPQSFVLYILDLAKLKGQSIGNYNDYKTITAIYDTDGQELAFFGDKDSGKLRPELKTLANQFEQPQGILPVSVSGQKYLVSYVHSPLTDLQFTTVSLELDILQPVQYLLILIMIVILFVVLLGAVLIYFAMRRNYLPIYQIHQKISRSFQAEAGGDSLQIIDQGINTLTEQVESLQQKIVHSKKAYRHYAIITILNGEFSSFQEFEEAYADTGIKLKNHTFACVNIFFGKLPPTIPAEDIVSLIESEVEKPFEVYGIAAASSRRLIFVLSMPENQPVDEAASQILDVMIQHECTDVRLDVGKIVHSFSDIRKSYATLAQVASYRYIRPQAEILFYDRLGNYLEPQKIDLKEQYATLNLAIRSADKETANRTLAFIFDVLADNQNTLNWVRMQTYRLVQIMINILNDRQLYAGKSHEAVATDIFTVAENSNIDELKFLIGNLTEDMINLINEKNQIRSKISIQEAKDYIAGHCYDFSFSAAGMADDLNVSKSYLSRFFRDQTSKTIIEYVNDLRLDRAKELLTQTSQTVSSIVAEIGFIDVSSFTKKFRTQVGMTPLHYRNQKGY